MDDAATNQSDKRGADNVHMRLYPVPQNVLQATLDYLITRPWREVNDLMRAFEKIAIEAEKPTTDEQG